MTTFFTSDLHLGHKLVSGIRGFGTPIDAPLREWTFVDTGWHDQTIAQNWDAVVQPEDEVWVLGDVSINSGPHVAEWFAQRQGTKHLVSGNHDKSHTAIFPKYAVSQIEDWANTFASIQDEAVIEIAGRPITLSHFPFWSWGDGPDVRGERGPNFRPRYESFRPWEREDTILLHGHTHGAETAHERSYHVGLDAHSMKLVPESTIVRWIDTLD